MPSNDPEYQKNYIRQHYAANKQYYKDKQLAKREANAVFVERLKSTLKCSRCPESDPRCLDFHHIDPSKKVASISHAVQMGWSTERIVVEISKCIPLCSNCHRKEHLPILPWAVHSTGQDAALRTLT